eukprot:TRINITY_DN10390_c0_g1_i1.p1 TRINITY_DN10390_c0_g1~~TRINITY_DN10390_c0_g1_i1.p1  ORF type:complete len:429 (+),score=73.57 TRINITY_DN10390_c0_g1_i1:44-1330(+)
MIEESFFDEITNKWKSPRINGSVYTDYPRLANRMTIHKISVRNDSEAPSSSDKVQAELFRLKALVDMGAITNDLYETEVKNIIRDTSLSKQENNYEEANVCPFLIYMDESNTLPTSSNEVWIPNYILCIGKIVSLDKEKYLYLFRSNVESQSKNDYYCTINLKKVFRLKETSRYFVGLVHQYRGQNNLERIGMAFLSKADSGSFETLSKYYTGLQFRIYAPSIEENTTTNTAHKTFSISIPESKPQKDVSDSKTCFINILKQIVSILETPDITTKLNQYFEANSNITSFHQLITEEIFEQVIGKSSKTFSLLRAVNQSIISPGATRIKLFLNSHGIQTGDVAERSGWRVIILFQNNHVQIKHYRRERGLGVYNGFWFEWLQSLTLDSEVKEVLSCGLSITDLHCDSTLDEDKKKVISDILQNGNFIIA